MLDWLNEIDTSLFLLLNGLGHPFLDQFMVLMSDRFVWFPFYGYLIFRLYQQEGWSFYQPLVALGIVILLTDQTTSSLMKPFFERIRPCHNQELDPFIVEVGGCGGMYGFASGHAANAFGLASFFLLKEMNSRFSYILLCWASVVAYSRVYLGVHYPGDVIVGAMVGFFIAYLVCTLLLKIQRKTKAD